MIAKLKAAPEDAFVPKDGPLASLLVLAIAACGSDPTATPMGRDAFLRRHHVIDDGDVGRRRRVAEEGPVRGACQSRRSACV